jgi:hypothetical protein
VGPLRGQGHCLPCRGQRSAGGARTAGDPVTRVLSPCSLGAAPVGFEGHARRWGWQRRQRWRRRGCERPQASTTEATPPACYHEATPPGLHHRSHAPSLLPRSHAPSPLPQKPRPQPATTEATPSALYHGSHVSSTLPRSHAPSPLYHGNHASSLLPRKPRPQPAIRSHAHSPLPQKPRSIPLSRKPRPQPSITEATPPAFGHRSHAPSPRVKVFGRARKGDSQKARPLDAGAAVPHAGFSPAPRPTPGPHLPHLVLAAGQRALSCRPRGPRPFISPPKPGLVDPPLLSSPRASRGPHPILSTKPLLAPCATPSSQAATLRSCKVSHLPKITW